MPYTRPITSTYQDPLEIIWTRAAQRVGMALKRSDEVFASWDGQGGLSLGTPKDLDRDDSLAQMVLHEICHALVEGPGGQRQRDWGLENVDDRHLENEHACLRLQAALADPWGLRDFLGATTQWRPYWDALGPNPLTGDDDPAIERARRGHDRAQANPWRDALHDALKATAELARIVRPFASSDSLWKQARGRHRYTGFPLNPSGKEQCGDCAWYFMGGPGRRVSRCQQSRPKHRYGLRVPANAASCERWEPRLSPSSCQTCGACCREGFDLAPVGAREQTARQHPELLVRDDYGLHLPRPKGHCVALQSTLEGAYHCNIYADRPRACSELAVGSHACLMARRRVGLSR